MTPIHRSAWKEHSVDFVLRGFSEVGIAPVRVPAYPWSSHAAANTSRGSAPSALKAATNDPSGPSNRRMSGSCCNR